MSRMGRFIRGVQAGVIAGCGFSLFALGVFLIQGSKPFEQKGTSLGAMCVFYLTTLPISGGILGVLYSLQRSLVGAAVAGVLAFIPIILALRVMAVGLHHWSQFDLGFLSFLAIAGGVSGGLAFHQTSRGAFKDG